MRTLWWGITRTFLALCLALCAFTPAFPNRGHVCDPDDVAYEIRYSKLLLQKILEQKEDARHFQLLGDNISIVDLGKKKFKHELNAKMVKVDGGEVNPKDLTAVGEQVRSSNGKVYTIRAKRRGTREFMVLEDEAGKMFSVSFDPLVIDTHRFKVKFMDGKNVKYSVDVYLPYSKDEKIDRQKLDVLVQAMAELPMNRIKRLKRLVVSPYADIEDWESKRIFDGFTTAFATASWDGTITYYNKSFDDVAQVIDTLKHEYGHIFDNANSYIRKNAVEWAEAMKKDGTQFSDYSIQKESEDYADAIREYIRTNGGKGRVRERYGHRFAILDQHFAKDPGFLGRLADLLGPEAYYTLGAGVAMVPVMGATIYLENRSSQSDYEARLDHYYEPTARNLSFPFLIARHGKTEAPFPKACVQSRGRVKDGRCYCVGVLKDESLLVPFDPMIYHCIYHDGYYKEPLADSKGQAIPKCVYKADWDKPASKSWVSKCRENPRPALVHKDKEKQQLLWLVAYNHDSKKKRSCEESGGRAANKGDCYCYETKFDPQLLNCYVSPMP